MPKYNLTENKVQFAKDLRHNLSAAEQLLWKLLRNRNLGRYKFRRQYLIPPFVVDYVCLHKKLIVELDGESHNFQKAYDIRRTQYLNKQGFRVLRIKNSELYGNTHLALQKIIKALES